MLNDETALANKPPGRPLRVFDIPLLIGR
jgi:hypothetical protein